MINVTRVVSCAHFSPRRTGITASAMPATVMAPIIGSMPACVLVAKIPLSVIATGADDDVKSSTAYTSTMSPTPTFRMPRVYNCGCLFSNDCAMPRCRLTFEHSHDSNCDERSDDHARAFQQEPIHVGSSFGQLRAPVAAAGLGRGEPRVS